MFGWKDDSLQKAMDTACYVNCPTLKTQEIPEMNACTIESQVDEDIDGCKCFTHFIAFPATATRPGFRLRLMHHAGLSQLPGNPAMTTEALKGSAE
jgi:hypothetical protein